MNLSLLTPKLAVVIEPWFDDPDTARHLGGRDWIHHALNLMHLMPGMECDGTTVLGRYGWVIDVDDRSVAFLDVEVYDDRTASLAIVVAPEARGRGIARRVLSGIWEHEKLAGVDELFGSISVDNEAIRRCLLAAGFKVDDQPDHEGMYRVTAARPT